MTPTTIDGFTFWTKTPGTLKREKYGRLVARFILTRISPIIVRVVIHLYEAWYLPLKQAVLLIAIVGFLLFLMGALAVSSATFV
jgi:uncharacterized membrane protein